MVLIMIRSKLMSHQNSVVEFCQREETEEYAGIFAEYGTGKTLIALAYIRTKKDLKRY